MKQLIFACTAIFTVSFLAFAEEAQPISGKTLVESPQPVETFESFISRSFSQAFGVNYNSAATFISTNDLEKEQSPKKDIVAKKKSIAKVIKKQVTKKPVVTETKKIQAYTSTDVVEDKVKVKQAAVVTSTADLSGKSEKENLKKFSSVVRLTAETDFKNDTEIDKTYGSGIDLFLNYKFNDEYKVNLWLQADKDLSKGFDETVGDSALRLSKRAYELGKGLKLTPSTAMVYPTSKKSKVQDGMITALDFSATLSYQANKTLSLSYTTRPKKYFHKYKVNRSGKTNKGFQYLHFLGAGYSFTDKVSFRPTLIYVNTWSYSGRKKDDSYLALTELVYSATKRYSYTLGVMNSGSIISREKGRDKTIEFYDENTSSIYAQMDIKL